MLGLPPMLEDDVEGDDLNMFNHGGGPPLAPSGGGGMRMHRHMGMAGGGPEMLSQLMRMVGGGAGPGGHRGPGLPPRAALPMRAGGEFFPQGLNLGEFASDIMEARAGSGMMGMPIRMRIGDFDGRPMHIEVR